MNRFLLHASAFLIAALPLAASAQETAPEAALGESVQDAVETEVHQNHSSSGLPQFNPATWPSQIFWLAISFFILYVVFSRIVLPAIGGTIAARTGKIEGDIATAEALSAQADAMRQHYEAELQSASASSAAQIKQIEDEAKARIDHALADFRDHSQREIAAADLRLEASKAKAMQDMQKIAAEAAVVAAEKIAGVRADAAEAQRIVGSLKDKAA
jgi:F-type H+-transporting ATPase subunit b